MKSFNYKDYPIIKLDTAQRGAKFYWGLYKHGTLMDLALSTKLTGRDDIKLVGYIKQFLEEMESGDITVEHDVTYTSVAYKDKPLGHEAQFQLAAKILDLYMEIYNVACIVNYNSSILTFIHDKDKDGYHKQVTISVNESNIEIDSGLVYPNIDAIVLDVNKKLNGGLYQSNVDLSYMYRFSLPIGTHVVNLEKADLKFKRTSKSAVINEVELYHAGEVFVYDNLTTALLKYIYL